MYQWQIPICTSILNILKKFAIFLNLKVKLKLNKIPCDKYLFYMYMYYVKTFKNKYQYMQHAIYNHACRIETKFSKHWLVSRLSANFINSLN